MPRPPRSRPLRFAILACAIFMTISLVCRLLLLVAARHHLTPGLGIPAALLAGTGFDLAASIFAALPWLVLTSLLPTRLVTHRAGRMILTTLLGLFLAVLIFIAAAEWFFWDEFSARFNFIAVDYLIWTQEVLGNISESYPLTAILSGIGLLASAATWLLVRRGALAWAAAGTARWRDRATALGVALVVPAVVYATVSESLIPSGINPYLAELAKNGPWSFCAAFRQMELPYTQWYLTLPEPQMLGAAKQLLASRTAVPNTNGTDLSRTVQADGPERRWNVITICMESMSGEYMAYLGSQRHLTPNLDRLAGESIFFPNLYATGTRTVRGMEALTLNLPPTPGQAIIYRPQGTGLTTTFTPFLDRGYDCAFFYGGDGRFDFMNRYFSSNGCRIMDANAWAPGDITFKTSWGACDEDLFRKTLKEADAAHAANQPFHFFCMTTSNHRPYDFPAGRINAKPHKRTSAVQYADWALGDFINQARQKPWFSNTLLVIVSDHCASSAGKNELDVTKYRIPALLYNPELVGKGSVDRLCSQIDVMPTVFGLLHWNYNTLSYGHDQLAAGANDLPARAFVSNYQKIALLRDDRIAILKPNRIAGAYACDPATGELGPLDPAATADLVHDTITYYQSAAWLFTTGRLKHNPPPRPTR